MKAILVIDIPDYLANKKLYFGSIEILKEDGSLYDTLVCLEPQPIRPMPQKKEVEVNDIEDIMHTEYSSDDVYNNFIATIQLETDKLIALGWNACLDEIGGQHEDTL